MRHLSVAFLGLLTVLLLASTTLFSAPASGQACNVTIRSPSDGATVTDTTLPVDGTATNVPDGRHLWLVVYSYSTNLYYAQHGPVYFPLGEWFTQVHLVRSSQGGGEKFEIMALLADERANGLLASNATNNASMNALPDGAAPYQGVTVTAVTETSVVTSPSSSPSSSNFTEGLPGFEALLGVCALGAVAASMYLAQWMKRR